MFSCCSSIFFSNIRVVLTKPLAATFPRQGLPFGDGSKARNTIGWHLRHDTTGGRQSGLQVLQLRHQDAREHQISSVQHKFGPTSKSGERSTWTLRDQVDWFVQALDKRTKLKALAGELSTLA